MDMIKEKEHKELHKKIYDCSCKPYLEPHKYCGKCENVVIEFMDEHGAGVLTRDIEVGELTKKYSRVCRERDNLLKKLEDKTKRVEELKNQIDKRRIGISINPHAFDDI